jgi:phosphoglycolate phosphatase
VIFDYDGTIVDTTAAFVGSINEALRKANLRSATRREISGMDLRSIITERLTETASRSPVEAVFDLMWNEFADTLSSRFPLREGAAQTLSELSRQGMGLALISKRGGRAGTLPLVELRMAGLEGLFRYVKVGVGLKEYGPTISKALAELQCTARDSVIVSDWCKDIEYAKRLGSKAVGITGGVSDEDEHKDAGADWVVERLIDIPTLLSAPF